MKVTHHTVGTLLLAAIAMQAAGTARAGLDPSFGDAGVVTTALSNDAFAYALVLQPDGKLVAAGSVRNDAPATPTPITAPVTKDDFLLIRYNPDGTLDASFGANGIAVVPLSNGDDQSFALVLQADGKLVAAGLSCNDTCGFAVARFNSDGTLDTSFGDGGQAVTAIGERSASAAAVALQPDGKVIAAGSDNRLFMLVRYNTDGSVDPSFGDGGIVRTAIGSDGAWARALVIEPDGRVVAAGGTCNHDCAWALVRYEPDGSLDSSFGVDGRVTTSLGTRSASAYSLVRQPDGKLVAAGTNGLNTVLVRYRADGTLDASFGSGGIAVTVASQGFDAAYALTLQPDGGLIAAREAAGFGAGFVLTRYTANGRLDTSFGTGGVELGPPGSARALALQGDGSVVAAGYTFVGAKYAVQLARYVNEGDPPRPTATPTPASGSAVSIDVGDATVHPGGAFTISVTLSTNGYTVSGTQNDILFDPTVVDLVSTTSCRINPAISNHDAACETGSASAPCKTLALSIHDCRDVALCPSYGDNRKMLRAIVVAFDNINPIPDGELYSCTFLAQGDEASATLGNLGIIAAASNGDALPAEGRDGVVILTGPTTTRRATATRSPTGTPTPFDSAAPTATPTAFGPRVGPSPAPASVTATPAAQVDVEGAPSNLGGGADTGAGCTVVRSSASSTRMILLLAAPALLVSMRRARPRVQRPPILSVAALFVLAVQRVSAQSVAYVANAGTGTISVIDADTHTVTATIAPGVGIGPSAVAVAADGQRAYVANHESDTISVVEVATNRVVGTIDLGEHQSPVSITLAPIGARAYVANAETPSIAVLDLTANTVIASILIDGTPRHSLIAPDGTRLYVATRNPNGIAVIDTAARTVVATLSFEDLMPGALAITPDGVALYAVVADSGTLALIDTASDTASTLPVTNDGVVTALAIAPDGRSAYLAASLFGFQYLLTLAVATGRIVDATPIAQASSRITSLLVAPDGQRAYGQTLGSVVVIDIAARALVDQIGVAATDFAMTPDGARLYLSNCEDGVCVVDTASNTIATTIPSIGQPFRDLAVSPDGARLVVSGCATGVCVVDAGTRSLAKVIPFDRPDRVAASPDQRLAYLLNGDNTVGTQLVALDLDRDGVSRTLQLSPNFTVPTLVAAAPDGSTVYVAFGDAAGFTVVDAGSLSVASTIDIGARPEDLVFTRDGAHAYVRTGNTLSSIEIGSGRVDEFVTLMGVGVAQVLALTPDGARAYVLNSSSLTVVDLASGSAVATISGRGGKDMVMSPDGSRVYVAYESYGPYSPEAVVAVIDTATNTIVARVVSYDGPAEDIAISRDGARIYVVQGPGFESNLSTLFVIDTATNSITGYVNLGVSYGGGVVVAPDGSTVYAGCSRGICVIDTATNRIIATTHEGPFIIMPDGTTAYSHGCGGLCIVDLANHRMNGAIHFDGNAQQLTLTADSRVLFATPCNGGTCVIDTSTNAIRGTIATVSDVFAITDDGAVLVGNGCGGLCVVDVASATITRSLPSYFDLRRLAVTPSGSDLYVTSAGNPGFAAVIDTASRALRTTIAVGVDPAGIALTPTGAFAYVINTGANTVSAIDTATHAVVATIPVGRQPVAIAIAPAVPLAETPTVVPSVRVPSATPSATPTRPATRTPTITPTPPTLPGCGNGVIDTDEQCDDGNISSGDGCASNCTTEHEHALGLAPHSVVTLQTKHSSLSLPLRGTLNLALGSARGSDASGEVPVAIAAAHFAPLEFPGIGCVCVRLTGTDPLQPADLGVGAIGCGADGLAAVSYVVTADHKTNDHDPECVDGQLEGGGNPHPGVCNGARVFRFNAGGPRGSAAIRTGLSITVLPGACAAVAGDHSKGVDGIACTADDPLQSAPLPVVLTTGAATARLMDADNLAGRMIAPDAQCGERSCDAHAVGKPFDCATLSGASENFGASAMLAGVTTVYDAPPERNDLVVSVRLEPSGEPVPTPTPTVGVCGAVCDDRPCGVVPCPNGGGVTEAHCSGVGADGCECGALDCGTAAHTATPASPTPTRKPPPLPAGSCGPAPPRFSDSLCGPDGDACVVLRDEVLPFGGYGHSLAIDSRDRPQVFFTTNLSVFGGHYATRGDDGEWIDEPTSFAAATAAFVLDSSDIAHVLAYDGAGHTLWSRLGNPWLLRDHLDTSVVASRPGSLARDDGGCFHAGVVLPAGAGYARRTDHWGFQVIGERPDFSGDTVPSVALAPSGQPHLVHWENIASGGSVLRWAAPPLPAETVPPLDTTGDNSLPIALAVTGDDNLLGTPHLLFNRYARVAVEDGSTPLATELVYASRPPSGAWSIRRLAIGGTNEFAGSEPCGDPPLFYGQQTCVYTYETLRPVAITVSGGDVRLLFVRNSVEQRYLSRCRAPRLCEWEWQSPAITESAIELAWPHDDTIEKTTLVVNVGATGGTASVDSHGRTHALITTDTGRIRYFVFGRASERLSTPLPTRTPTITPTPPATPTATCLPCAPPPSCAAGSHAVCDSSCHHCGACECATNAPPTPLTPVSDAPANGGTGCATQSGHGGDKLIPLVCMFGALAMHLRREVLKRRSPS
jgi:uncharacterized delta-60 repeat protein